MHFILQADDDGLVSNPVTILRSINAPPGILEVLISAKYILLIDGICVITHWHIHNHIRKDRLVPSVHTTITSQLRKTKDNLYIHQSDPSACNDNQMATTCQPNDNPV